MLFRLNWRVDIQTDGRSGFVYYREGSNTVSFYWEFGGNAIATISIPPQQLWDSDYAWAADRKQEVLQRVGRDVVRQKARGYRFEIDEPGGVITII